MGSNTETFCTDSCMVGLYESLVRDFETVTGPSSHRFRQVVSLKRGDIKSFRDEVIPERLQAPASLFKREAQLDGLFKRYRFSTDYYTDDELSRNTFEKFAKFQEHLALHMSKPIKATTFRVLQRARSIVKDILKDFDPSQLEDFCRFSTRATVGNTARESYLDHKLADPISGSPEHIRWFLRHLSSNYFLSGVLGKCSPTGEPIFDVCTSLPLVGVPKSYKSLRLISPNTLIGSYYTYGLGKVLVEALKKRGLDVAKLQHQHKRLARFASRTRTLVTADLTSASEAFLFQIICRLLPRKWLRAAQKGRIRQFRSDGKDHAYMSFMAMGIGFTFPLQTLLFYAIVKSCCELLEARGPVSVYGDDLIYPRRAHNLVKYVLNDIGMILNVEKTFVESYFRESCGGDYYHGVDVRPFSPEGSHQNLRPRKYEAWLYQLLNGLQLRWDDCEIPNAIAYLHAEILRCAPAVKQVPPSFPDYSGWRVNSPMASSSSSGVEPVLCAFRNGSRYFKVKHLSQTGRRRFVSFEDAYLYDRLRQGDAGESAVCPLDFRFFRGWLKTKAEKFNKRHWFEESTPVLELYNLPFQPRNYRGLTGRRLKRTIATTSCKLTPQKIQTRVSDSISDWI